MAKEWFEDWFNTPYYHLLYNNRNDEEASRFISNLVAYLAIDVSTSHILDLACGKGRHSIYLNKLGFRVTGVDLSENSIHEAQQHTNNRLDFRVHDMRQIIQNESFSHVFNLFTSFGYFEHEEDNVSVLRAIEAMLKPNGIVVIDFMNASKAIKNLVEKAIVSRGEIDFHIQKHYDGKHIYKNIRFEAEGDKYNYTEKVQALKLNDFISLLSATKLQLITTFGDFDLNPYSENDSDRLIIVAKKVV